MSAELNRLEQRALREYEWARLRRGLLGATPMLLLAVVAGYVGSHMRAAVLVGTAVFATAAALLWRGQQLKRAVVPGVLAGLVPLTFALCATRVGHVCMGDSCMSFCVPACTAGGVLAGAAVTWSAARSDRSGWFWTGASSLALLTGALGCACIGWSGLLGLAGGFLVSVVPGIALAARRKDA